MSQPEVRRLRGEVSNLLALVTTLLQRLRIVEEDLTALEGTPGEPDLQGPVESTDRVGRERLARQIGRFIRRALRGEILSTSGRDRLALQNRCYLVFQNFAGERFDPPIFTQVFSEVRDSCKRGSDCGRSIFIGLATFWEAAIVVEEAGVRLPAELRNAHARNERS